MKFNNILKLTAVLGAVTLGHKGFNQPIAAALADAPGHVIINEIYGAGGNNGAALNADFVELYNPTNSVIDLTGWGLSYRSATNEGAFPIEGQTGHYPLTGKIDPQGFYLVKKTPGANGVAFKAPDKELTLDLAAANGRIGLLNGTQVIDFVGFGTANVFEGTKAPAPSLTKSITRVNFADTDNNGADFILVDPTPLNSGYGLSQEIMFGIGLNAEGNCEEVFYILEEKYNALPDAVRNAFAAEYPEAHARYQYLAAFTASQQPIQRANQNSEKFEKEAVIIIALTSLSILVGYYVFQTKKSE